MALQNYPLWALITSTSNSRGFLTRNSLEVHKNFLQGEM